jgi:methylase of polypeptide subunit release factors
VLSIDAGVIAAARDVFRAARYTNRGVVEVLGTRPNLHLDTAGRTRAALLVDTTQPLGSLVSLFLLENVQARDEATAALGREGVEALLRAGLIEHDARSIRAQAMVVPHDDVLIASDCHSEGARRDWVPGVARPSDLLVRLTPRRHVGRALDVATGNGIQAILASCHADEVVATDLNERALDFARFNLALNECHNVELRCGDLLAPVHHEKFDLVTANPPYVVSPEDTFLFRDSGRAADALCRSLVAQLPGVLEAGGVAVVLVSWIERDPPDGGPLDWLRDPECGGLLLSVGMQDPVTAAVEWNRDYQHAPGQYVERAATWLAYYRSSGAIGIGYGALVVRRGGATAWRSFAPLLTDRLGLAGDHVMRLIDANDLLARPEPSWPPLQLAPDAELSTTERVADGVFAEAARELRLQGGLGYEVVLDAAGALLVRALATPTAAVTAVAATASSLGQAVPEIAGPAGELVAELVSLGFLVAGG